MRCRCPGRRPIAGGSRPGRPAAMRPGRPYAFVVHGLWPQYEQGWPENCDTRETWVPDEIIARDARYHAVARSSSFMNGGSMAAARACGCVDISRLTRDAVRQDAAFRRAICRPQAVIMTTPQRTGQDFVKTNRDLTERHDLGPMRQLARRGAPCRIARVLRQGGRLQSCGDNETAAVPGEEPGAAAGAGEANGETSSDPPAYGP